VQGAVVLARAQTLFKRKVAVPCQRACFNACETLLVQRTTESMKVPQKLDNKKDDQSNRRKPQNADVSLYQLLLTSWFLLH